MSEFIGRFHPLIVHLPIGILLIALLLFALTAKAKYKSLEAAIPVTLLAGTISALFSCITGYMLSSVDDYDETLVNQHMWMGIAVTIISLIGWLQFRGIKFPFNKNVTAIVLFISVTITGHLGGSLTHGSDYLSAPFKNIFAGNKNPQYKIFPLKNAQEAKAYSDVVKPILQTKCYSCHNGNKQKGSLRMDDSLLLMKGGKHGVVIDLKDLSSSELLERIQLPVDNDHHMPPKEKPQLTESQVALLHWWIINGSATLTKKVKEIQQDDKTKKILAALQQASAENDSNLFVTLPPVEKPDVKVIDRLRSEGIMAEPVTRTSNYLAVSFISKPVISKENIVDLMKLRKQVISLNLRNSNLDDTKLAVISSMQSLVKLDLSETKITDVGLSSLQTLFQLQSLHLVGDNVSEKGLTTLKNLKNIKQIFIYNTGINATGYAQLKKIFPKLIIDTGGYHVPILPGDTTMLKTPYKE